MYKLLIVDDEEIERRAIEHIINKSSINISEIAKASNGQEAVAVASTFEPNIIIMDITMPGLNGIKAANIIKQFLPDSHIIFLTAFDEFDYVKEALKLGADDFLVKPASPDTIEGTINNSIRNIESKKELQKQSQITKEKLHDASKYLEECLVEALIDGESNENRIEKYLSFTTIDFDYSYGVIISLSLGESDLSSDNNLQIKIQMIMGTIRKQIEAVINKNIIYVKYPFMYVLIYDNEFESIVTRKAMLFDVIEKLRNKIYQEHKVDMVLGIGDICNSTATIWKSFMQAKEIVLNKKELLPNSVSLDILDELSLSIVNNDKHIGRAQIRKIQNTLENKSKSIEDYRIGLLSFSISLKQSLVNKLNRPITIDDCLLIAASKINSIEKGTEYLDYYVEKLRIICSIDEHNKNEIIINQLAMYIKEHVSEHITLEHMSEISKLSSFYICKLFKRYLNMNFIDYITFIRMKTAKDLLKNPYLSIKEISFKSGYTDPNYFARVFKNEIGLSPTNYRNQHVEQ